MNKSLFCIRNYLFRGLSIKNFIIMVLLLPIIITCTRTVNTTNTDKEAGLNNEAVFEIPELDFKKNQGLPIELSKTEDLGLYLYRNPLTKNHIVSYLDQLTGSAKITDIILRNANNNNIPVSLAFSLAFAESSYNPNAVNSNETSIDRGLFQLNSKSFPELTESDFFNPETNAKHGLAYLAKSIERGGNEIVGLAMYNAGSGRVTGKGTPKMTLDYISKIINYKDEIDAFIMDSIVTERSVVKSEQNIKSVRYVLNTEIFNSY